MDRISADLAAYYEDEAADRLDRPIDADRITRRDRFVERCRSEGMVSILDVGMGPGRDAVSFRGAGLRPLGLDLAHESARLARVDGVPSIQGSLYELPARTGGVDAVWTMSTLVHVPDARFDEAMSEIVRVVRPGGFVAVGLWGGRDQEGVLRFDEDRPGRFFSLRTADRARAMLDRHGEIVVHDVWGGIGSHAWDYLVTVLRVEASRR